MYDCMELQFNFWTSDRALKYSVLIEEEEVRRGTTCNENGFQKWVTHKYMFKGNCCEEFQWHLTPRGSLFL
jgi:hypothetical protein